MTNGDDVEAGIREWRQTKADAEAARDRARVAEQDATFVRGQLEVLQRQKHNDDATIKTLQADVAEMELLVDTLGGAVLSILEKRKAGTFRRAGSIENGGERLAAIRGEGDSAGEPPDQNDRPAEQRPARPLVHHGGAEGYTTGPGAIDLPRLDLRKLERDIADIPNRGGSGAE